MLFRSALGFGGTATLNNIGYWLMDPNPGTLSVNTSGSPPTNYIQTASATVVTTAMTSATQAFIAIMKGTVSINAGGTFSPQYQLSAAPGGAYTTNTGSYFVMYPIGAAGSNSNVGGWS